jgi:hypothetical protein
MTLYRRKPKNWLQRVWFWFFPYKPKTSQQIFEKSKYYKWYYRYPKTQEQFNTCVISFNNWFEANYEPVE